MIPALDHVRAGRRGQPGRLARRRELAREQLRRQRLRRRIRRVVDDEAALAEHALEPAREGVRHADAGRIRVAQLRDQRRREFGRRDDVREVVDDLADRRVEDHVRDRHRVGGRAGRQRDVARLELIVEHGAAAHLVPIVIFRFDPEDGDGRNVVLARDLLGQLDRRERLQQREQRAAEEPRLLAGDDRDGAGVRQAGGRRRSRAAAPDGAAVARRSPRRSRAAGADAPASARSRAPNPPRSTGRR